MDDSGAESEEQVQPITRHELRLVEGATMPRTKSAPVTQRLRPPTITGRLPEDERREMKAECVRRGVDLEDWVAYACRLAYKRKEYPPKKLED